MGSEGIFSIYKGGKGVMGRKYELIKDVLVEFKPRYKGAVYGVRNASYRAYVWDLGRPPKSWEGYRFKVSLVQGMEDLGHRGGANTLREAKKLARSSVKGRAFRSFLRRMR